jgi:hypothetical protein
MERFFSILYGYWVGTLCYWYSTENGYEIVTGTWNTATRIHIGTIVGIVSV